MSNIINNHGWLGGSVVPACGRGTTAGVMHAGFPAVMGAATGFAVAGTPTRTRGTDVSAAVKPAFGATHQGRPAWSPPHT